MVHKIIDYLPIQRPQKTSTFHRNVSIIAQNVDALKKNNNPKPNLHQEIMNQ